MNYGLLDDNQRAAVRKLESGSILVGGVGSGKSRTAIAYWLKDYPKRSLFVITTPHKRDTHDWSREIAAFDIHTGYTVDSWNNIEKYTNVKDAFFIFDEQRLVGKGVWAKSFLTIAKHNAWLVLTATPGDTWMDYVTIFLAHNFFKNRTDFYNNHVVFSRVARYPKVERYYDEVKLESLRDQITVNLACQKKTTRHFEIVKAWMDLTKYRQILKTRFDEDAGEPYRDGMELVFALRRESNSAPDRLVKIQEILRKHKKLVVFYSFDYELDILRNLEQDTIVREWNGHKHEKIPEADSYVYLVQYMAGAEGWECFDCNCMVFYSLHYSYKIMEQCCGRIDRRNTAFDDLWYYLLVTNTSFDRHVLLCLKQKKMFNERKFMNKL